MFQRILVPTDGSELSAKAVNTALVRWAPGTVFNPHRHHGGEEIFVLQGQFQDEFGNYRSPHISPGTRPSGL